MREKGEDSRLQRLAELVLSGGRLLSPRAFPTYHTASTEEFLPDRLEVFPLVLRPVASTTQILVSCGMYAT